MDDKRRENIISLYIPPNLKRAKYPYSVLLHPFWGVEKRSSMLFYESTFNQRSFDTEYYTVTEDSDDVDYVFLPYNYWFLEKNEPDLIKKYIEVARDLNVPLLIDAISDSLKPISIKNSVVLRYSHYKKKMTPRDIMVPMYAEDLLLSHCNGIFTSREKGEKARIGFTGWSSLPLATYYRTYIKDLPFFIVGLFTQYFDKYRRGVILRRKAVKVLQRSKSVIPNFILRSSFSGNIKTAEKGPKELRNEFVKNILESDYTLCVRGDANQSTRFFEVLSLGRIPIFVDTDIQLPLSDIIDYKEFCIFVDYQDINKVDKIVADFHSKVSPEKFKDMQKSSREVYEMYLRVDAYTPFLMEILKEKR